MNNCLLLLKGFNNYFNRKIIFYNDIQSYVNKSVEVKLNEKINFNPADGINSEQILNVDQNLAEADYLLLLDETADTIISRWFIIETDRLRNGQYNFKIRRDVIADHYNEISNAPIFVEKAMVSPDDPMIFNSEGMFFNRIKKSEMLLRDASNTAWIVGYAAKDLSSQTVTADISLPETETGLTITEIAAAVGIEETTLTAMLNTTTTPTNIVKYSQDNFKISYRAGFFASAMVARLLKKTIILQNNIIGEGTTGYIRTDSVTQNYDTGHPLRITDSWLTQNEGVTLFPFFNNENFARIIAQQFSQFKDDYESIFGQEYISSEQVSKLQSFNGKKIIYNGSLYVMQIGYQGSEVESKSFNWSTYPSIRTACQNTKTDRYDLSSTGEIELSQTSGDLYITLTLAATKVATATLTSSVRATSDQMFNMFVMPYSDIDVEYIDNGNTVNFISNGDICRRIAAALATKFDSQIYDVQLLPYFPVGCIYGTSIIATDPDDPEINIAAPAIKDSDYSIIVDSDNNDVGIILWCNKTSFTNVLNYQIVVSDLKISNECDLYRLTSPNYNGMFEFSVAKNGGSVDYFFTACSYKPYNPYVRVAPNFKGLYGKEFGDARGLILGGDFSLPRVSDAWEQYQLQNKNYNLIFDRQIQNLDFTQDIAMRKQLFSATVGAIGASAATAVGGFKVGGVPGAIIGAGVGLGAGALGGMYDTALLSEQMKEQRDYQIDMYNYQLGNIRALPYSLTKVGTFDISNKLFPFVEYYTCSEQEQKALEDKIQYESMTVMRIGTINQFLPNKQGEFMYFKGQLIRTDAEGDAHVINEINLELMKGVFL